MKKTQDFLLAPKDAASIAFLRALLGFEVAAELFHYYFFKPFLKQFYIEPDFHFKYHFFGWVPDLPPAAMKAFLPLLGVSFVLFGLGAFYRVTKWTSFLGFAYLFLMERASFLNHWYLVCLVTFLFLFIPANVLWSVDVKRGAVKRQDALPAMYLYALLLLVSVAYFYSGFVKIDANWMTGVPMQLYLENAFGTVPEGLGWWLANAALVMELLIVPALLWRKTRPFAFGVLVLFHISNYFIFTIGLFPLLMTGLTTLYFAPDWPRKVWQKFRKNEKRKAEKRIYKRPDKFPGLAATVLSLFFLWQILFPLRSFLYYGDTIWREEGFLFAWKMMMDAKSCPQTDPVIFWVQTEPDGPLERVDPKTRGLTWAQEEKMARNPDLILQFAHHLGAQHAGKARPPRVFTDAYLAAYGRPMQRFIHPNVDLMGEPRRPIRPYDWVLPLESGNR